VLGENTFLDVGSGQVVNRSDDAMSINGTVNKTALLLACLGLYGVTMAAVSARTREIGVRMAIGASRAYVLRQVLGTALVQVVAGLAIGLPLALAAGTLLQSRLFGVGGHDPLAITAGTLALVIAAVAAALVPARRAATLDPIRALRTE